MSANRSHMGGRTPRERIEKVVDYYLTMERPAYQEALIKGGGYSLVTARQGGAAWFRRPDVQEILQEKQAAIREKSGVTTDALMERLKFLAFGDIAKFIKVTTDGGLDYDFTKATPDELKIINEITVDTYNEGRGANTRVVKKFRFTKTDTLRAIEMLGRMIGAFKETVVHEGELTLVARLQRGRAQVREVPRPPTLQIEGT